MVLRTRGPAKLPDGYKLTLHMCQGDTEKVRVFRDRTSSDAGSNFLCEYQLTDRPLLRPLTETSDFRTSVVDSMIFIYLVVVSYILIVLIFYMYL